MTVNASLVKELRDQTGCGFMDCKAALAESGGNIEVAVEHLRKKGIAAAAKKAHRATSEGLVEAYVHPGGRIGVLLEVNCETDFVARTEDFKTLVRDLTLQIAAASPNYISSEDVPAEVVDKEKEILLAQARATGKPEKVLEKIVAGRLGKFFEETCLLEQQFVKDQDRRVKDIITEYIAKLGENIQVHRFQRYQLGKD